MIKYLGSKRVIVPILGAMAEATAARTAVDLFTGTTRVAQEFKRRGIRVTANDIATYSEVFSQCYISTNADDVDGEELGDILNRLGSLPGKPGYFTRTFCEDARFFQPKNGARIDAIRDCLEDEYRSHPLFPVLLTSLILAADRVDSTTGQQMAYLKSWAPRASGDLQLRVPDLLPGSGQTLRQNASELVLELPRVDLVYLDPPYNQHRYFTNYHIWETLVRWDRPTAYGVAKKRIDARDEENKSIFNKKRHMRPAFEELLRGVNAEVVMVSFNDESWITQQQMIAALRDSGHEAVEVAAFDFRRYVGAQIGIYSPSGERVGKVSHVRNKEFVFVAGPRDKVEAAVSAASA